jgi:hypothetical protein
LPQRLQTLEGLGGRGACDAGRHSDSGGNADSTVGTPKSHRGGGRRFVAYDNDNDDDDDDDDNDDNEDNDDGNDDGNDDNDDDDDDDDTPGRHRTP